MLLALTIVLILSCLGMAVLLFAKSRELSTGRLVLAPVRPGLARAAAFIESAGHSAPPLFSRAASHIAAFMRDAARAALARLVIAAERLLERSLEALRRRFAAPRASAGEPSGFLREVAEEKRRLTRTARLRRASRESPPEQSEPASE